MSQWGFYFNQNRCVGCKTCMLACKVWNEKRRGDAQINTITAEDIATDPKFSIAEGEKGYEPTYGYIDATGANNYEEMRKYYMKENWRRVTTHDTGSVLVDRDTNTFTTTFERSYLSLGCNHCSDPECMKVCPMGVYYKEEDYGMTLYQNSACISCGRCQSACPWSVPQFYAEDFTSYDQMDPKRPRMTKCTGCLDRVREGLKPACVAGCWNRALDFGPIEELKKKYSKNGYIMELPEFKTHGTRPMIIFRAKQNSTSE